MIAQFIEQNNQTAYLTGNDDIIACYKHLVAASKDPLKTSLTTNLLLVKALNKSDISTKISIDFSFNHLNPSDFFIYITLHTNFLRERGYLNIKTTFDNLINVKKLNKNVFLLEKDFTLKIFKDKQILSSSNLLLDDTISEFQNFYTKLTALLNTLDLIYPQINLKTNYKFELNTAITNHLLNNKSIEITQDNRNNNLVQNIPGKRNTIPISLQNILKKNKITIIYPDNKFSETPNNSNDDCLNMEFACTLNYKKKQHIPEALKRVLNND